MKASDTMAWVATEELRPRLMDYVSAYEETAQILSELIEDSYRAFREYSESFHIGRCYYLMEPSFHPNDFATVSKAKRIAELCYASKSGEVLIGEHDLSFVQKLDPTVFEKRCSSLREQTRWYREQAAKNRVESLEDKEPEPLITEVKSEETDTFPAIITFVGIMVTVSAFFIIIAGGGK